MGSMRSWEKTKQLIDQDESRVQRRGAIIIIMLSSQRTELLKLSPSERLLLVQDLWDSLDTEDIPITEEQKDELDRRKTAYQANPASGRSWEDVKRRIIEKHG